MAVTGSGINIINMTASGDSMTGPFFIQRIQCQFTSAAVVGQSVELRDGQNSTIFRKLCNKVADNDGWAIMHTVDAIDLEYANNCELFVYVGK